MNSDSTDEIPTPIAEALVAFATELATIDAVNAAAFLRRIDERDDQPDAAQRRYPAAFLLGLGAAMRVCWWEERGIDTRGLFGLDSGRQYILQVIEWCRTDEPAECSRKVSGFVLEMTNISLKHFAWRGLALLGSPVLLSDASATPQDEEAFLDALAEYCWNNRLTEGHHDITDRCPKSATRKRAGSVLYQR